MQNNNYKERVIERGNFWFLEEINKELYDHLFSAEKSARINFKGSMSLFRTAIENFIDSVIIDSNLKNAFVSQGFSLLDDKIKKLQDEQTLRNVGYLSNNQQLREKTILKDHGKIKYTRMDGEDGNVDYYTFLRFTGNRGSHIIGTPGEAKWPKIIYDNVIKALKAFHIVCKTYYSKRISANIPDFDEWLMPIKDYRIYDCYIPHDCFMSKCQREFRGYMNDSKGEKVKYAVLRLYNENDVDERFLLRNNDAYNVASKHSYSSVPKGMIQTYELTEYQSQDSSFYIISHIFNREPKRLTESILKKMSFNQRIRMCYRIVDCLCNLHKSKEPIYHRLLSYESIYICEYENEWIPYIVKFDFAKIASGKSGTVKKNVSEALELITETKRKRYLAPEWENNAEKSSIDWGKVDIYSVGILLGDILMARVGKRNAEMDELESLGLSDSMRNLLDKMLADNPQERPIIDMVFDGLEEEVRKWK